MTRISVATLLSGPAMAGIPLWTFTPQTATSVVVSSSSSATVTYLVTNQSRKTHSLVLEPINGVTQDTSGSNCKSPFVLGYLQSCTLALNISGANLAGDIDGGPIVCQEGSLGLQCYRPSYPNRLKVSFQNVDSVLTVSSSNLLLQAGGNARVVNITNGSNTYPAYNVDYMISPALPTGTSISPASCGTIAPGGVCTLTITPGANPSTPPAPPGGSTAVPSGITVTGSNTNTVQTNISVLTYANIVENGLIFEIDDSTPNTQSIAGKVVGQSSQQPNPRILWTATTNNDITGATSFDNGVSNTDAIVINTDCTNNTAQCAAYYCRTVGTAWYLPAINELSTVYTNVKDQGFGSFANAYYWSSTQDTVDTAGAFARLMSNNTSATIQKDNGAANVETRCTRSF